MQSIRICLSLAAMLASGCAQNDFGRDGHPSAPLGPRWGSADVSCEENSDCDPAEACIDGTCQMRRCGDTAVNETAPPLNQLHVLRHDDEVVISDSTASGGTYSLKGLAADAGGVSGSWQWRSNSPILDMAGGRFSLDGGEGVALANAGSSSIRLAESNDSGSVGFQPIAIAAGDTDGDGLDEVAALSSGGIVAVCDASPWSCDQAPSKRSSVVDIAVADIDGDRYEEVLVLEADGETVHVWNIDGSVTGDSSYVIPLGERMSYLSAADLDGDGFAELVGLQDSGWLGLSSDRIYAWRVQGSAIELIDTFDVNSGSLDVEAGDIDRDQRAEILVLRDDFKVDAIIRSGPYLTLKRTASFGGLAAPSRLAIADLDDDSAKGRLISGPELIAGDVVPTLVIHIPPYYESHSHESPWILIGDLRASGSEVSKSIGLHYSALVGTELEVFGTGIDLSTTVGKEIERSTAYDLHQAVGPATEVIPNPEEFGYHYAAVMLSCACFQSFTYELEDPHGAIGPDATRFVAMMPAGGTSQMWSSIRYNAMAEKTGLPIIDIPYKVGDPHSYPSSFQRADGTAVPEDDLVFTDTEIVLMSDVGQIGWELLGSEAVTNETAMSTSVKVDTEVSVGGVRFGVGLGGNTGAAQSVSVGREFSVLGLLPPVVDDPATPEDEHEALRYAMRPTVYREHYTNPSGDPAAYYVLSYAVDP